MPKSLRLLTLTGLVVLAAACARQQEEEVIYVEPEPVQAEPTFTGKL